MGITATVAFPRIAVRPGGTGNVLMGIILMLALPHPNH